MLVSSGAIGSRGNRLHRRGPPPSLLFYLGRRYTASTMLRGGISLAQLRIRGPKRQYSATVKATLHFVSLISELHLTCNDYYVVCVGIMNLTKRKFSDRKHIL
jgi:hypothetical protein